MNRKDAKPAKISGIAEPDDLVNELSAQVVDAALEVHRNLGPGFFESVYEEALAVELHLRKVPFERQVPIGVNYKGFSVGESRLDLLVDKCLVVELKAVEYIAPVHVAQALSYLKASRLTLALLITFNVRILRQGIRRVVLGR
jgi:GxxExxY protein